MPGTTYTATPDTMHDPPGRLADFARFGVQELGELLGVRLEHPQSRRLKNLTAQAHNALVDVANILEGFTTFDD